MFSGAKGVGQTEWNHFTVNKKILTLLTSVALLIGGLFIAAPAQAANNWVLNHGLSTCNVQYKDPNGTIRTIYPAGYSTYSVWMVRVPVGCTGTIQRSNSTEPAHYLYGGTWQSFTALYPQGTSATVYATKN